MRYFWLIGSWSVLAAIWYLSGYFIEGVSLYYLRGFAIAAALMEGAYDILNNQG